ncbi:hypothetical protein [Leifsonia sp. NPDC058248]|uniref:hypothetical protein n=1 Tax=Leifsonia sp. NPDC058248 TaxID=3346402 RepID=UPI0036D9F27B
MTLWQDPPPQTRRQARENERSAAEKAAAQPSRRAGTSEPTPGGEIPIVTTPYTFATTRNDAEQAKNTQNSDNGGAAEQAEKPAIPATAFEEPGVSAPSRPNLPSYGTSFDELLAPQQSGGSADAASQPGDPAYYRQSPQASVPEPVTTPVALVPGAVRPADKAPDAVAAPPAPSGTSIPASPAETGLDSAQERTLTRRELRAMLQAQEANNQVGHIEPTIPITFTSPEYADDERGEAQSVTTGQSDTPESSVPTPWPFVALTPSAAGDSPTAAPVAETPATPAPPVFTPPIFGTVPPAPQSFEAPAATPAVPDAHGQSAAQAAPAAPDAPETERAPYTPPVGHWTTAAELDDKNQPFDQIISRGVGPSGAATTTNALILPTLPTPDATGPLTSTGEILVTGSIDLPRGLGSTGAHPNRIDSSDLDRLLESDENEFNTSEVAPIRASRAVSTHTSTRGVITPPKKRGGRLPVVLSITAAVLAVGVIGLLIAAYVLNVF